MADAARVAIRSLEDVIAVVRHGAECGTGTGTGGGRRTSHTVLTFIVEQESCGRWGCGPPRIRRSKLNLVTLADYAGRCRRDVASTPRTSPRIAKGAKGGIDGRDAWDGG